MTENQEFLCALGCVLAYAVTCGTANKIMEEFSDIDRIDRQFFSVGWPLVLAVCMGKWIALAMAWCIVTPLKKIESWRWRRMEARDRKERLQLMNAAEIELELEKVRAELEERHEEERGAKAHRPRSIQN